jgi:hypothetical protein
VIDNGTTGHSIAYLTRLARDAGYDVDLSALTQVTARHPDLVTAWVVGGIHHAALSVAADMFTEPVAFLRDITTTGGADADTVDFHATWLADLLQRRTQLTGWADAAERNYGHACRALLGTGLITTRQPTEEVHSGQPV